MKTLILILVLIFLSGCGNQASTPKGENTIVNNTAQPSLTVDNTNQIIVGKMTPVSPEESAKIDEAKRRETETQNEKLMNVPENLKKVDFGNLKYPSNGEKKIIPLRNGSYQYEYTGNGCIACGGETYDLKDVYYTDLTNNDKKEAIVHLTVVSCGGSCDGGSDLFYIYSIQQNKLKLLWQYETGSLAYGCGLKSFIVKDKKITIEQFGRCENAKKNLNDLTAMNKFQVQDTTRFVFGFNGQRFVQENKEIILVPTRSVMDYASEISIDN